MLRKSLFMLSLIFLTLCMASAAMWVRSYFRPEAFSRTWAPQVHSHYTLSRITSIHSVHGELSMGAFVCDWDTPHIVRKSLVGFVAVKPHFEFGGIRRSKYGVIPNFELAVPYWFVTALFTVGSVIFPLGPRMMKRRRGFAVVPRQQERSPT